MVTKLNAHEQRLLQFLEKYPGQWHSFKQDSLTKKTVFGLLHKLHDIRGIAMTISPQTDQMALITEVGPRLEFAA